ncbi:MAG: TolC family protein [Chitinophagaceae bacterium]|nr:TolC family protein [Chitinophagaceae bacterium]MCW5925468.1 TolC family protein [Chitinophagaceae bacterium]
MKGKRVFSLFIIFSLLGHQSRSQQMITLQDAIAASLNYNYDIVLLKNDMAIAGVDKQFIFGGFLPRINGVVGVSQTISAQEQEFDSRPKTEGSGIRNRNINAAVNLNWVLFDGLRMFVERKRILEEYDLSSVNLKNQVVNTTAEVISSYYTIVRQKQQLKAIEEQMSINEERVKLADRKLSVGLGTKPELLQAKVDLNAQKAMHLQQRTIMSQTKEQLNQLTGMRLPSTFEVADSIPINNALTIEEIMNGIEDTNPTILQAKKALDISTLSLKESIGAAFPTISFVSGYNFTRNNNHNNINPFAPINNMNKGWNIGLTANIPIFDVLTVNRPIVRSSLNIKYNSINLDRQKNLVDIWVKVGYYNYQYQLSALQLEEENIDLAKENVLIAMERFKLGVSTFLELREAQKSLEDAYDRLIAARYNTKVAETELLRLKGDLVR